MLRELGLKPLLNLNLRLGGTGAALAMSIVEASCRIIGQMSIDDAGVSKKL